MINFIDKIACGIDYDSKKVLGYTKEELNKIERLHDIKISGSLYDFLFNMGRCDGGLVGDDPIILYSNISIRGFILLQAGIQEEIYDAGFHNLSQGKPFVFSIESETQYYYLRTDSDEPERVYRYDENTETVVDTGQNFIEYLQQVIRFYNQESWEMSCNGETTLVPNNRADVICRGELLI